MFKELGYECQYIKRCIYYELPTHIDKSIYVVSYAVF